MNRGNVEPTTNPEYYASPETGGDERLPNVADT